MVERKRVGGLTKVDPAVSAWQSGAAENPATVTPKKRRDRQRVRMFIDVTPELKAALEMVAGWQHGEDSSVSQTAELLLTFAVLAYKRSDAELLAAFRDGKTHAKTPKFSWNLEIPETWATKLERFSVNGNLDGKVDGNL